MWFISYMYGYGGQQPSNTITEEHPLDWMIRTDDMYPGQYVLMNWIKLSDEEVIAYTSKISDKFR